MLASSRTFSIVGVTAAEVHVEVDASNQGLPAFSIVGLPDTAVRESRERVRAALVNSGVKFPGGRITANLAPANMPKVGPSFDLAIAAAMLAATGELAPDVVGRYALAGELALDGAIRPVPGVLAMAEAARAAGLEGIAVAAPNGPEAALVDGIEVVCLDSLRQLTAFGRGTWQPPVVEPPALEPSLNGSQPDLADLRGQPSLRRALEIAAAGGHNLFVVGPPGAGKSMAARRLPSILPPLSPDETLEVTRIASACGREPALGTVASRPFRAPHHTISAAGLVGGGNPPRAGEITLAHRGVLFLDEMAEFQRTALEALRQPIEDGALTITRAGRSVRFPCRVMLVAAANPCPCGRGGDECRCGPPELARYHGRLSGALADRIDIFLAVEQPSTEALASEPGEESATVRQRVAAARSRQVERLGDGRCNAEMDAASVRLAVRLNREGRALLADTQRRLGLSGRAHDRVLKVARTVADLMDEDAVSADHIAEALMLRRRWTE